MKYLLLVIALMVAVAAAAFFVPVKDGRPLLQWGQVKAVVKNPERVLKHPRVLTGDTQQQGTTLYRWRDSNGNWQYGDVPPTGVDAQPVNVKPARTLTPEEVRKGRMQDNAR